MWKVFSSFFLFVMGVFFMSGKDCVFFLIILCRGYFLGGLVGVLVVLSCEKMLVSYLSNKCEYKKYSLQFKLCGNEVRSFCEFSSLNFCRLRCELSSSLRNVQILYLIVVPFINTNLYIFTVLK